MASVVKLLTGTVNGVNREFTTPAAYVAGSIRPIINGLIYDQSDSNWGCTELNSTTIRINTAPPLGSTVQAFYVESESTGSPFDPNGSYP